METKSKEAKEIRGEFNANKALALTVQVEKTDGKATNFVASAGARAKRVRKW